MARKWTNLNLPGALHYVSGNVVHRVKIFRQKRCCLAFFRSAKDYPWSSFRARYFDSEEPLPVDRDCWWPEDAEKLKEAMKKLGWPGHFKKETKK